MNLWLFVLPTVAAGGCAAWRVWRRHRVNSTLEFLAAVAYGVAAGATVISLQLIVMHVWVNTWGAA